MGFTDVIPVFVRRSVENAWVEVSQGLDASAKIYGYRVDALHIDTFRIRGELFRRVRDPDPGGESSEKTRSYVRNEGEKTLESESGLSAYKLDTDLLSDPLFKKATAKFDERGAKGLTQNISRLSPENLEIMFYGSTTSNSKAYASNTNEEYQSMLISQVVDFLNISSFCELADPLINYKLNKLEKPIIEVNLPPLSEACTKHRLNETRFQQRINETRSQRRLNETRAEAFQECEKSLLGLQALDEELWLSKLRAERVEEDLSIFAISGSLENSGMFMEESIFNTEDCQALGLDLGKTGTSQENLTIAGNSSLGNGNSESFRQAFILAGAEAPEEKWHQFQQLRLPARTLRQSRIKKEKENSGISFNTTTEFTLSDLTKSRRFTSSVRIRELQKTTKE